MEPAEFSIHPLFPPPDSDVRLLTTLITSSPTWEDTAQFTLTVYTPAVSIPGMLENSPLFSLHNYYCCLGSGKLGWPVYNILAAVQIPICCVCERHISSSW